ncbi:hypothetical protein BH23ACT9_BH23ACT9_00030 [soil metagenome]
MAAPQRAPVSTGERAADFVAPRGDGRPARFYGHVGGAPSVLVFSGAGGESGADAVRDRLRTHLPDDVALHLVATGEVTDPTTFSDQRHGVHGAYGLAADGDPVCVVLDPNVRVVSVHDRLDSEEALTAVAEATAAARHDDQPVMARPQAPVMFVPDALSPLLCADLMQLWAQDGNTETGVEASVGAGRGETADRQRKRRRDHTVTDPEWLQTLSTHLGRRVMPEIRKAFAYQAKRFEGFKIGCYDAEDQGFFTAHRDNLSPATAHRVFALTVNLNDGYGGGELAFPEYGPERYRPAAGEALVFSGSLLHEVLPVSEGRRFVLLSFLFGDEQRPR